LPFLAFLTIKAINKAKKNGDRIKKISAVENGINDVESAIICLTTEAIL
jgi:hypothetical protein